MNEHDYELDHLCRAALSSLRLFAANCPDCEGYGGVVYGPSDEESWEEACMSCKPLRDLIEHLTPKPEPTPQPEPEPEDDIAF